MEVLDMGCGAYAVLASFAKSRFSCKSITAVDLCKDVIDFASESDSTSSISYHHSDLFDYGLGLFDLIVFNAPYLTQQKAEELGMAQDEEFRERFCGGADGADTIRRFLADCPMHLKEDK
jgi:methylase of polypeptide subunit release factors